MRPPVSGPRDAQVAIIGGGAVGAAVAYFLARDGWQDIQLLERRGLCEETSSQAALHEYFVTEPVPGWHPDLPCLRIPEVQVYARGEGNRVLCGGFENRGTSIDPREVAISSPLAARPDWDVLAGFAGSLSAFVPGLASAGVCSTFQGWPAFTPDGRFIVGPVSAIRGLALAAGCNAHGVSGSAGLAMHLVESLRPDPSPYVRSLSPDRFVPRTWSWEDARRQARAVYETYYPMPAAPARP